MQRRGLLALVLHTHLPFVRHPEHPKFLEEQRRGGLVLYNPHRPPILR